MSSPDPDLPLVLVASADAAFAAALHEALPPHAPLTAVDGAEARRLLAGRDVALLLADFHLPDETGLALLEGCAQARPAVLRLLLADYDDLPEIIRARASGMVRRVIPRSARPRRVRQVVAEELGAVSEVSVTQSAPHAQGEDRRTRELVRWTVERLARSPRLVIRELPEDQGLLQVQWVIPTGARLEKLRGELALGWTRLKERGHALSRAERKHPVTRQLPELSEQSELYAHDAGGGSWLFLVLLPWRRAPRVTVVLGALAADRGPWWALLQEAHRISLEEVKELPLPELPSDDEATGTGQHALEYDWVVTRNYVGPDRRREPTGFLNKFMLVGRRKRVPSSVRSLSDVFVDRLGPRVIRWGSVYLLLAALDTVLTFRFVRDGTVRELNPLLARLVFDAPLLFFAVKNALALLGLFLVARFHLFRAGYLLLGVTLAGYALLDLYWLWLLL